MLKTIYTFIKKHKLLIAGSLFLFLLLLGIYFRLKTPPPSPGAVTLPQTPYKGNLLIGSVSRQQLIDQLGTPLSTAAWIEHPEYQIDNYPVAGSNWNTQVFSDQKTLNVDLVIEQSSPTQPAPITLTTPQYPEPPVLLFGNLTDNNYYLQLYPQRGVGYLARYQSGDVFQTYYFQPTTDAQTFVENIGQKFGFQLSPPEEMKSAF